MKFKKNCTSFRSPPSEAPFHEEKDFRWGFIKTGWRRIRRLFPTQFSRQLKRNQQKKRKKRGRSEIRIKRMKSHSDVVNYCLSQESLSSGFTCFISYRPVENIHISALLRFLNLLFIYCYFIPFFVLSQENVLKERKSSFFKI